MDDKEFVFLGFNLYLFGQVGIVEIILGWFYDLDMFLLNELPWFSYYPNYQIHRIAYQVHIKESLVLIL